MKHWIKNIFWWWTGLFILILNKPRHALQGYTRPRAFSVNEFDKAVDYDLEVVRDWAFYWAKYQGVGADWKGHRVLELGPGADFGVGITLLASGAASYHALDAHLLAPTAPDELYEVLAERLNKNIAGFKNKIHYVCDKNFDVTQFRDVGIDLIMSNAAFEHFDDVEKTIKQMSEIVQPGGVLIAEVDLQTHSRWIRDADPLNIYRYSEWLYRLLSFSGTPNRVRPASYRQWLEKYGWNNIVIYPKLTIPKDAAEAVRDGLIKDFKKEGESLGWLSFVVCAAKK